MSSTLEAAWDAVLDNIGGRPVALAALVAALDRRQALDEIKQRVLAEAAAELRVDRQPPASTNGKAAPWLCHQLADGERRVRDLKAHAARDGIGWRSIERAKRSAGVTTARHDRVSWWSLITPPSPPTVTGTTGTLNS